MHEHAGPGRRSRAGRFPALCATTVRAFLLAACLIAVSACGGGDDAQTAPHGPRDASAPSGGRAGAPAGVQAGPAASGDAPLRAAAEKAGIPFRNLGPALPAVEIPAGDLPLEKLLIAVARQTGRSAVVDADAVAAHQGGMFVTRRFVLAGVSEDAAKLVTILDSDDPDVRDAGLEAAANALGGARTPFLGAVLGADPDSDVRSSAAEGLGEVRDRGSVASLVAALGDEDEFVRQMARSSLLLQGEPNVRPALEDAARTGTPRVREMARTILDENYSREPGDDAGSAPDRAVVAHDLEGRRRTATIAKDGATSYLVTTTGGVLERREGRVESAAEILGALAARGVVEGRREYTFGAPGLAVEPDFFVLFLGSEDTDGLAWGDLRGAPREVRDAVTQALDAAAKLPAAAAGAALIARSVGRDELEATRAAGVEPRPIDVKAPGMVALADAFQAPGAAVPCDETCAKALFPGAEESGLVVWNGEAFEVTLLRAVRGAGGR